MASLSHAEHGQASTSSERYRGRSTRDSGRGGRLRKDGEGLRRAPGRLSDRSSSSDCRRWVSAARDNTCSTWAPARAPWPGGSQGGGHRWWGWTPPSPFSSKPGALPLARVSTSTFEWVGPRTSTRPTMPSTSSPPVSVGTGSIVPLPHTECLRVLVPDGAIVICYLDWLPLPGNVVAATEAPHPRAQSRMAPGRGIGHVPTVDPRPSRSRLHRARDVLLRRGRSPTAMRHGGGAFGPVPAWPHLSHPMPWPTSTPNSALSSTRTSRASPWRYLIASGPSWPGSRRPRPSRRVSPLGGYCPGATLRRCRRRRQPGRRRDRGGR